MHLKKVMQAKSEFIERFKEREEERKNRKNKGKNKQVKSTFTGETEIKYSEQDFLKKIEESVQFITEVDVEEQEA